MSKYLEQLKTGNPDRKVSRQEFLNVMGEFFQEETVRLKQARRELKSKLVSMEPEPKQRLPQRLMRALRHIGRSQNASGDPKRKANT